MAPASVNAIVATLDLQLVRLLRAAFLDDAKLAGHGAIIPEPIIEPRLRHEPEPFIEPRKHVHPTPYFEARPIIHPAPRIAPAEDPSLPPLPEDPGGKCPIQPPWKVRPWEAPVPMKREVKVVVVRPDIVSKGSLIDFFC
ncbi:MAG: hypothetical protein WBD40_16510 [Tepidisphaeraceae bacterium]